VLLNCQRTRRTGPPSPNFPKEGEGFEPSRPFLTEPSALATRRVNPLCQPSVIRRLSAYARRRTGEQLSSRPQWGLSTAGIFFLYCSTALFFASRKTEGEGFEPPRRGRLSVFETDAFAVQPTLRFSESDSLFSDELLLIAFSFHAAGGI
jgi:hypothetical protein